MTPSPASEKKTPQKTLMLLDAHAIIHRAYHALPNFRTRDGRPTGAIFGFISMIFKIIEEYQPDYLVACYDLPGPTFRHHAFEAYKGTRSATDEELKLQFEATREVCELLGIPIYDEPGFEADDMLGTIVEQIKNKKNLHTIIASGDMDTLQLVSGDQVQVYTLKRGLNDTILYNEPAVQERFHFPPTSLPDYKGLRGDSSDNIPGIKGIGDKGATLVISEFTTLENLYDFLDKEKDVDEQLIARGFSKRLIKLLREGREDAFFSKVLATIRRDAPIEFSLPKDSWRESVRGQALKDFLANYELRNLEKRIATLFPGMIDEDQMNPAGLDALFVDGKTGVVSSNALPKETATEQELLENALKVWLLDSDMKEAFEQDILDYTRTKSWSQAIAYLDTKIKENPKLEKIYLEIEQPLIEIIKGMTARGIVLDQQVLKKMSASYRKERDHLEQKMYELAGRSFNPRSPKQLSELLFGELELPTKGVKKSSKTGNYSTNIDSLEKLQGTHDIIDHLMEYRELDKLITTYIDVFPTLVADDGRIHAEFIQHGTTTGRFSSREPNMQNLPTRSDHGRKIRESFIAEPGHTLMSFDYSQVELRCLAILSGDQELVTIFQEGRDIHRAVAALIGGVPEDQVDREMRRKAKIVNFGILYGMGVTSLHKQMGGERSEAQLFHQGFFDRFPRATAYLEETKEHARQHGYTETFFGRRRQFKDIKSKLPFIRAMAERMALNAPIQGTSADMIKLAMVHSHRYLKEQGLLDKVRLVLQIHDEIVFEVANEYVADIEKVMVGIMEKVLSNSYLNYDSPVPLAVHSSHGQHLAELK